MWECFGTTSLGHGQFLIESALHSCNSCNYLHVVITCHGNESKSMMTTLILSQWRHGSLINVILIIFLRSQRGSVMLYFTKQQILCHWSNSIINQWECTQQRLTRSYCYLFLHGHQGAFRYYIGHNGLPCLYEPGNPLSKHQCFL